MSGNHTDPLGREELEVLAEEPDEADLLTDTPVTDRQDSATAGARGGTGLRVRGFEEDSKIELCRLRVQRWLTELRVIRGKVEKQLIREEQLQALTAQGKSASWAALQLLEQAETGKARYQMETSKMTLLTRHRVG